MDKNNSLQFHLSCGPFLLGRTTPQTPMSLGSNVNSEIICPRLNITYFFPVNMLS